MSQATARDHQSNPEVSLGTFSSWGGDAIRSPLPSLIFSILYFFISLVSLVVLFCLPRRSIHKIYRRMDEKGQKKKFEALSELLSPGESLLDLGSGNGRLGYAIKQNFGVPVTGVDVCHYDDSLIPFRLYNGAVLPFENQSFDVVLFASVLHHIRNQEELFAEACRVARKRIIIFEDSYDWVWERWFAGWNDYQANILQGWIKALAGYQGAGYRDIPIPRTFRSVAGWRNLFRAFPVRETSLQVRMVRYKPLKKIVFCLDVTKD